MFSSVMAPSPSSAPRKKSVSSARTRACAGGGERKSNLARFCTPRRFSVSTTAVTLLRRISGTVCFYASRRATTPTVCFYPAW